MKTFYKLFLVLHAGKKSSNYFPGWQKHNSLISWKKGEQKKFLAGSKVLWRRSWLASAFYNIRLAGSEERIKFSHES